MTDVEKVKKVIKKTDIEKAKRVIKMASEESFKMRGIKYLSQLEEIVEDIELINELKGRSKFSLYMILAKLYYIKGDYKKTNKFYRLAEEEAKNAVNKTNKEKMYYARLLRARSYIFRGTPGDKKHLQNLYRSMELEIKPKNLPLIKAILVFDKIVEEVKLRLSSRATIEVLNLRMEEFLRIKGYPRYTNNSILHQCIFECEIWIAITTFNTGDILGALTKLEEVVNSQNQTTFMHLVVWARIQAAFIYALHCNEFYGAAMLLKKVKEYEDDLEPFIKLIYLIAKREVAKNFKENKELQADKEELESLWKGFGIITQEIFQKEYTQVMQEDVTKNEANNQTEEK